MKVSRTSWIALVTVAGAASTTLDAAIANPQLARETNLPCASCHLHGPLLNEFGQRFYANGFRIKGQEKEKTHPLWVQLGARASNVSKSDAVPVSFNSTAVSSLGFFEGPEILYRLMIFPLSRETDLFLLRPFGQGLTVQAGRFGTLSQFNTRLELSPSLPAFLDPAIFGFAPGAESASIRATIAAGSAMPYGEGWKLAATVPFSPSPSKRSWDFDRAPEGVFLEGYRRWGVNSLGLNFFAPREGDTYYGTAFQYAAGLFYLEGGAGYGSDTSAYSLSVQWIPDFKRAFGVRIDGREGDLSFSPMLGLMVGDQQTALRLVVEVRIGPSSDVSTVVTAAMRF